MYHRKTIKQEAKQLMRASVPHFMLVALVYYLLTTGLNTAASFLTGGGLSGVGVLSTFLTILISLFGIVMGVGFTNYSLRLARKEETGLNSLFHGFSFAGRSIGMTLLVALYSFLWTMLVLMGYAVVAAVVALILQNLPVLAVTAVLVLYVPVMVLVVIIVLRYSMATFALVENPDVGVSEAIRRSVRMLRGHKGKLFVLELSFIGWDLLVGLIVLVVMVIGIVVSGAGWMFESLMLTGEDVWEVYAVLEDLLARITPWTLLAELLALPLNLWLLVYKQTAFARFFNYVGGYDYHQYMNAQQNEPGAAPAPPLNRAAAPAEPSRPVQPPAGGYYTPAPTLESPTQAEPEPEEPVEEPEEPTEEPEVPDGDEEI